MRGELASNNSSVDLQQTPALAKRGLLAAQGAPNPQGEDGRWRRADTRRQGPFPRLAVPGGDGGAKHMTRAARPR